MSLFSFLADKTGHSFKDLVRINDELRNENLALQKQGLSQAQDMAQEIQALMDEVQSLKQQLDQQAETANSKINETESESELLLLQLHQVQEELETVFLKEQETQRALQDKIVQQEALAKEHSVKLEAIAKEKAALIAERDKQVKLANEGQAKLEALSKENSSLITACDEQARLANERQLKIDTIHRQVESQVKDAQEENELLLLQLHQVQEELEHYFLEHQKLQRDNEIYISRWQRLEDRLPNYLDYLSIVPVSVDTVSEIPSVEWRATDITMGGVLVPEFNFATFLDDGNPGIEILGATDERGQLLPVKLTPRNLVKPNAGEDIIQFRTMSALHWRQINIAVNVIQHFFKDPQKAIAGQKMPEFFDLVFWRQASMPLVADIGSLPPVFRFNNVKLKRELINPDYEHLWLVFHEAVYGNYHWPKLELRLGAANIQPGGFSRYPKLEIPRIDGKLAPFDSWFEEAFDDFGGKLELRFDLNRQIFDINVWLQLSSTDQAMMLSLIGALNIALKRMEQDKVAISRSWDSWTGLASGVVDVVRRTLIASNAAAKAVTDTSIEIEQPEAETTEVSVPSHSIHTPVQPQRRAKKNRRKR